MNARLATVGLGVLLLASVGVTAQSDLNSTSPGSGPRVPILSVTSHSVIPHTLDIHEDAVAFASPGDDSIQIRTVNITSGAQSLVTSISTRYRGVGIGSLAYDGQWIAWSDSRFDNEEVFVVDTRSGNLTRLTNNASDDRQVDISDGRIVWTRDNSLHMASAATGEHVVLHSDIGRSPQPAIEGSSLAWVRTNGSATDVYLETQGDPAPERLTFVPEGGVLSLDMGGGRVIWTELLLELQGQEIKEIHGSVVRSTTFTTEEGENGTSIETAPPRNLTPLGEVGSVTAHGDHVAWMLSKPGAPGPIQIRDLTSNVSAQIGHAVGGLDTSQRYLVFADSSEDNTSGAELRVMDWATLPESNPSPGSSTEGTGSNLGGAWWLGGAGAVLIVLGVFWDPIKKVIGKLRGRTRR